MPEVASEEFIRAVGLSMKEARKRRGLTQDQLARSAGKIQNAVAKIESNPAKDIALRMLFEVCQGGGLSLSGIIAEAERKVGKYVDSQEQSMTTDDHEDWLEVVQMIGTKPKIQQKKIAQLVRLAMDIH